MDSYEYLLKKLNISVEIASDCKYFLQLKFNNQFVKFFPIKKSAKYIFTELHYLDKINFDVDPEVRQIIKLIRLFPYELESVEHVDLLLTLNGLNKA